MTLKNITLAHYTDEYIYIMNFCRFEGLGQNILSKVKDKTLYFIPPTTKKEAQH